QRRLERARRRDLLRAVHAHHRPGAGSRHRRRDPQFQPGPYRAFGRRDPEPAARAGPAREPRSADDRSTEPRHRGRLAPGLRHRRRAGRTHARAGRPAANGREPDPTREAERIELRVLKPDLTIVPYDVGKAAVYGTCTASAHAVTHATP